MRRTGRDVDERAFAHLLHFVSDLHDATATDDHVNLLVVGMAVHCLHAAGRSFNPGDREVLGAELAFGQEKPRLLAARSFKGAVSSGWMCMAASYYGGVRDWSTFVSCSSPRILTHQPYSHSPSSGEQSAPICG